MKVDDNKMLYPNCSDYVSTIITLDKKIFKDKYLKDRFSWDALDSGYVTVEGKDLQLEMDYTRFSWSELRNIASMLSHLSGGAVRVKQFFRAMNVDDKDFPIYVDFELNEDKKKIVINDANDEFLFGTNGLFGVSEGIFNTFRNIWEGSDVKFIFKKQKHRKMFKEYTQQREIEYYKYLLTKSKDSKDDIEKQRKTLEKVGVDWREAEKVIKKENEKNDRKQ
jgi:hypothetical protein